ncbi:hypothetical protein HK096_007093, partial [Nowakowskiella sp. JEL0078]
MDLSYVGSGISLLSNSLVRYVGVLHSVNPQESTVSLANVRSYGTEGRRPGEEIMPIEQIYDMIVFRGSDIKDLHVIAAQPGPAVPPPPQPLNDPAIISSQTQRFGAQNTGPNSYGPPQFPTYPHSNPNFPGYPPGVNPYMNNMMQQHAFALQQQQIQMQNQSQQQKLWPPGFAPTQNLPVITSGPEVPTESVPVVSQTSTGATNIIVTTSPLPTKNVPITSTPSTEVQASEQKQQVLKSTVSQSTAPQQPQQQQEQPKIENNTPTTRKSTIPQKEIQISKETIVPSKSEKLNTSTAPRKEIVEKVVDFNSIPKSPERKDNYKNNSNISNGGSSRTNNRNRGGQNHQNYQPTQNFQNNSYRNDRTNNVERQPGFGGHLAFNNNRGNIRGGNGGGRGGRRGNYSTPSTGFKPRIPVPESDFDFESMNAKFNKAELGKDNDEVDEPDNHALSSGGESDDNGFYNKSISFFDNISCEIKDRSEGERVDRRARQFEERRLNLETFGQVSIEGRNGYWRGGRGSGGYYGRGRGRGANRGGNRIWNVNQGQVQPVNPGGP